MMNSARRRRLSALIRKEILQITRDPSSLIIAFGLPLLLLFLFGYGVSLDAREIRLGLVIENPTPDTASFAESLSNTPFFRVEQATDRRTFLPAFSAARLDGIVVLAADFSDRLARGDTAPVQVLTDGSDPNTSGLVSGYVRGAWQVWQQQRQSGQAAAGIGIDARVWYNPELESRRFLVPGSIALVQMMIGTLLTAMVVAREWERGTIEALLATPVTKGEFLIGKVVPNFLLGMAAMGVSVLCALFLFHLPLRGSLLALFGITAIFLLVALSLGLLVSTVARTQFAASQFATLLAFLPGLFFSGFLFEVASMPAPLRAFAAIVPAKYYVQSLQTIFLVGDVGAILGPAASALAAMAGVLLVITLRNTPTRLD